MKIKIHSICLIIGVLLVLLGAGIWILTYNALTIFPSESIKNLNVKTFTLNRVAKTSSSGRVSSQSDSAVVFDYDAGTGFSYDLKEVSGVEFNFDHDTIDAAGYKYIEIKMNAQDSVQCILSVITGELLYDSLQIKQCRHSEVKIQLKRNAHDTTYKIPVTSLSSPFWWGAKIGHSVCNNLPNQNPDFSRIVAIRIYCDPDKQLLNPIQLQVSSIRFKKDYTTAEIFYRICVLFGIICIIDYVLRLNNLFKWSSLSTRTSEQAIQPAIECNDPTIIDREDPREEMVERIKLYIEIQFSEWQKGKVKDAEEWKIKVEDVAHGTAIKAAEISKLLEWNGETGFRAYVNKIQIEEAKRLLIETDMQVGRIAEAVGYGHSSNFNRVFKRIANMQPIEFREEAKGSRNV